MVGNCSYLRIEKTRLDLIMSRDEFLWVEKYRPKTIEECILPDATKKTFQDFLDKGEIPNMLLAGPAGCGKTTVAKALCNELGVDFYVINGSDEGRFLDTVRNTAKNFASTVYNLDNDTSVLLRRIYDACYDSMVPNSIPAAVLTLAKYQYQMAFVADQEINMLACLTELMVECTFK
jgi:DNA polymerase III delta prime subunit